MNFRSHWQPPIVQSLPPALRDWLTDSGSLTQQLTKACEQSFSVKLLHSGWQRPLADESLLLEQPLGQLMFSREVHLLDGNKAEVYARTMVPMRTYQAMQARFETLGNRSLGQLLFNDPSLRRGEIEVACLQPQDSLFKMATRHLTQRPDRLWARRSCFYLEDKGLLVNEIFLPSDKWSD
ncbi:chorismate--pyruvate lyase family protein [Methylophaga sp. OBS1]|uniref:chorismate--pyruvate lyase family protein n=1 Tax=Methylophaga sp. OBS1 TaxID=2991933 RepID=UPI00225439A1|nr:chorismate lyase [Methylophaga sp. OBS1]MCX4193028.1 chorismate lyase [Methylophaga sp. OBS1]